MMRPILVALFVLLPACDRSSPPPPPQPALVPSSPSSAAPASAPRSTPAATTVDPAVARLHRLLADWITATNHPEAVGLHVLYAPKIELYGAKLSAPEAVTRKRAVRVKHPQLEERVLPPIEIERREGGESVVSFTKRVNDGAAAPRDYRAYLRVREEAGRLWITAESDEITDRNLLYPSCEKLMTAILWKYVEHEGLNADMTFVELGPDLPRPDAPGEFGPKYEFKVGRFNENGPRMEHRAWVRVDPKDGRIEVQCPAYSSWDSVCGTVVEDAETRFVPVPFESDLRSHIPKVCGAVLEKLAKGAATALPP